MPSTAEYVEALKHINIASYALFVPTLILWIGLLLRMLISKDKEIFYGLIVISICMIVALIAIIATYQLNYTLWDR